MSWYHTGVSILADPFYCWGDDGRKLSLALQETLTSTSGALYEKSYQRSAFSYQQRHLWARLSQHVGRALPAIIPCENGGMRLFHIFIFRCDPNRGMER